MSTFNPPEQFLCAEAVGGKAAALLELQSAGFNVPDYLISPCDIAHAVSILGVPLAVRSSATVEDGRSVSFAGQFQSYLDLDSPDEVEAAVQRCRDSLHTASVAEYCEHHGIDPDALRMEVIVQRMVRPELAGVAFSVNPTTGANQVAVEACEGTAVELLAGRTSPLPVDHPLLQQYLPEIESLARALQRHFGAPQDVEFAIENGVVYVLQSRPITRIGFAPDVGEWTNAVFRDGGVSNGVCSPLMGSLYEFVWGDALKGFLREIRLLREDFPAGRQLFGRPYWNLGAVKRALSRLPGFVEREFDADLSVQIQYDGDGRRTPVSLFTLARAASSLWAIRQVVRNQPQEADELLTADFQHIERKYEPVRHDTTQAFRELIESDYKRVETTYFRTIFATSLAKLEFTQSFPDADYPALMSALPELRHMAPLRRLRERTAAGLSDIEPWLRQMRHHSDRGLDVRFPRWDEEREFVREMLDSPPAPRGGDPHPAYWTARQEAVGRLPRSKRRKFEQKLDQLRHLVWLREELRDLSSRMYYLIRRYALELGSQRGLGDDIFLMSFREILNDDRSNIEINRDTFESWRNFSAPNEIGGRAVAVCDVVAGALRGLGASPGIAEGRAHVAGSVKQALSMEPGAILVCPFVEPGWIPVLDRVAGVVTESGGMLSHAAVICREYGVPAVLGVAQATRRIPDVALIRVHGQVGHVEVLS